MWKRIGFSVLFCIVILIGAAFTYICLTEQRGGFETSNSAGLRPLASNKSCRYMGLYDPDKIDIELRNGNIVVVVAYYDGMSYLTGEWVRNNVAPEIRENVVWFDYLMEWDVYKNPYLFDQFRNEKNFGTVVLKKNGLRLWFNTDQFKEFQAEVKRLIK